MLRALRAYKKAQGSIRRSVEHQRSAGCLMLQTRVTDWSRLHGFLNGRRRRVSTTDQRYPTHRCAPDADHHVHAGCLHGPGVRRKGSDTAAQSQGNGAAGPSTHAGDRSVSGHDQAPSVKLNQEDVRWEDLEARLARIYLSRVEKVAFV